MTGFDSKRRIALDRLDDDDIQVYAQPNLKGESMTNDEALTLEALKYAASRGHGRMVREMKIAPFTIKETLAQPVQPVQPDLSKLRPEWQEQIRTWIAEGTFAELAIGALLEQEQLLLTYEKAAQPVQEPVAWMHTMDSTEGLKANKPCVLFTKSKQNPFGVAGRDYSKSYPVTKQPLYTAPPQRPWVGLTDDERNAIYNQCQGIKVGLALSLTATKLKEKNT